MKNKKEISEERIRLLETAVGDISDRFVREAHEAHSPEKKTKTKILTAPAWLRPVAACLAVLLLGGLVVFSIPVVNNIISRRAPAELPGTDVAEADTKEEDTTEEETVEETEEPECAIGDKKIIIPVGDYPELSINQLLDRNLRLSLIREEDIEKIKLGMTFEEMMKELGLPVGGTDELHLKLAINNGKMLLIERKYSNEDLEEMFKDQLEWVEDQDGNMHVFWPADREVRLARKKVLEENPIEKITVYDDPETWEKFVGGAIITLCQLLNQEREKAGEPRLTKEELRQMILEDDSVAEYLK